MAKAWVYAAVHWLSGMSASLGFSIDILNSLPLVYLEQAPDVMVFCGRLIKSHWESVVHVCVLYVVRIVSNHVTEAINTRVQNFLEVQCSSYHFVIRDVMATSVLLSSLSPSLHPPLSPLPHPHTLSPSLPPPPPHPYTLSTLSTLSLLPPPPPHVL